MSAGTADAEKCAPDAALSTLRYATAFLPTLRAWAQATVEPRAPYAFRGLAAVSALDVQPFLLAVGALPQAISAPTAWSTLNYVYDASGRRIEKKYDGRTVLKYIYDGDHCIAEYDGSNNLARKYIMSLRTKCGNPTPQCRTDL